MTIGQNLPTIYDHILHKTKHCNQFMNKKQQLQFDYDMNILHNLLDNKNIIICHPDKGNAVVVLNKSDYIMKMETILNDTSKFREFNEDVLKLSISVDNKIYRFISEIKSILEHNKVTPSSLHITYYHPGILYGVPKIHKTSVPMRPILSCIGILNLFLSHFTVKLLQPLIKKTYISRNCYHFLDDRKQANLTPLSIVLSYDVESLFTNIPVNETTDIITSLTFPEGVNNYNGFSKKQFVKLLQLCTQDTYFFFNDKVYQQTEGMAMDNPLGPIFADLFLGYLEEKRLHECPANFKPIFYRRYVDDTFIIFNNRNSIIQFHNYLNSKHHCLKFTYEVEINASLPFIGVLVTKNDKNYQLEIYHKPTSTDLFTNFNTFSPISHKIAAVRSLCYQAIHNCSSFESIIREFNSITKQFQRNSYPTLLLHKPTTSLFDKFYIYNFK